MPSLVGGFFIYMRKNKTNKDKGFSSKVTEQWNKDYEYYAPVMADWDEKEKILLNALDDSVSANAKSQIYDPRLATIILERSFRVMNQLATGKVRALTKRDKGKSLVMDMLLKNYIEPNANSQYKILKKFRIENLYSHVYGTFGHLVDYVVRPDYVGPDFYLIPARNLIPQPTKTTINDCDYVFVLSEVSKSWLKDLPKEGWQNIDQILEDRKSKNSRTDKQSFVEEEYSLKDYSQVIDDYQTIRLVTRYERDRWVTFAPDYNLIVRDIANPHQNGKIPVVVKHSIPLIDRFHGLGEIERGKTLQYAINSLWNLYLDGVKYSIFPPKMINLAGVVPKTIINEPDANWIIKQPGAIQPYQVSPMGLNTFQATYPAISAAMLNMAGTTDTSIASNVDPGMGKTPQALSLLEGRQNSRDALDRTEQEEVIQETYDLFIDLLSTKQEQPIKLHLFEEELTRMTEENPELVDMFESGDGGEIIISPKDIKDITYKYTIDSGSTYKREAQMEKQSLVDQLGIVMKFADPMEVKQTGKIRMGEQVYDLAEMLKRTLILDGIQDWDKIIYEDKDTVNAMQQKDQLVEQASQVGQQTATQNRVGTGDPKIDQFLQELMNG